MKYSLLVLLAVPLLGQELVETLDGDLLEIWDTRQTLLIHPVGVDKELIEIEKDLYIDVKSSDNNGYTPKNNGQVWENLTLWEELPPTGLFRPLNKISGLRNQTQSDSLDLSRGRIRQD